MLWAQFENLAQEKWIWYAAGGIAALIVIVVLFKNLGRRRRHDPEGRLSEDLSEYPSPPAGKGMRRLTINGMPVRVRLVVVAPTGKQHQSITPEDVPDLLDDLCRGISTVLRADKPRIRIWPPQLSLAGFAPTFHRLIKAPSGKGNKSAWVLVAGPTRASGKPILLGMALLAEEPTRLGQVTLEGADWNETIRVER